MVEAGIMAWKEEKQEVIHCSSLEISEDSCIVDTQNSDEIHGNLMVSPVESIEVSEESLQHVQVAIDDIDSPDSSEFEESDSSSESTELNDLDLETTTTSDDLVMDVNVTASARKSIRMFLEGVLEYTFSVHRDRLHISEDDITWLLHITNETLHLSSMDVSLTHYKHITFNICKFYLSRILLSAPEGSNGVDDELGCGLDVCPIKVKLISEYMTM